MTAKRVGSARKMDWSDVAEVIARADPDAHLDAEQMGKRHGKTTAEVLEIATAVGLGALDGIERLLTKGKRP